MEIRPLRSADEERWRPLWRAYLAFYETDLPDEICRTTFDRLTDASVGDHHGLIAVEDGAAVGLAHYIFHRHGWRIDDMCCLQDLFVAPQKRGAGLGRALGEAIFAAADSAGKDQFTGSRRSRTPPPARSTRAWAS